MRSNPLRAEEFESRWEAAPAIAAVIALQLVLAIASRQQHWELWTLPWWVWLIPIVPEALLLLPLAWQAPRRRLEQLGYRREVTLTLLGLVSVANALLLVAVIGSLIAGVEKSGAQLLLKAIAVWATNVIAFGLWFWALKYVSAAKAAPIQYLSTPISVLLAWWFLGERLTVGLLVGTLLVLAGVWLTHARRRRSLSES